jgi:hypothetical protein
MHGMAFCLRFLPCPGQELKKTLEKRGVLGSNKARIRAEIFQFLDAQVRPSPPPPPLTHIFFSPHAVAVFK